MYFFRRLYTKIFPPMETESPGLGQGVLTTACSFK
jgi:hypothetical protein